MESAYTPRHLWRWPDGVIALVILAIAGGIWLLGLDTEAGQTAVVTTPDTTQILSLSQDTTRTIHGRDGYTVTLQVKDGQIRFETADCPDQVCVHSGWLAEAGDTAACVPAGIAIRITGDAAVDGIAR